MKKILFSYWTTFILLAILGIGAAIATFIENDYGTSTSRLLVYNSFWYELTLILTIINMLGIMLKTKMWYSKAKFIFHFSFVFILLGAGITRYYGFEGIMHIYENETTNKFVSAEPYIQVTINDNGKIFKKDFQKDFSALGNNDFNYKIAFGNKLLELKLVNYKYAKKGKASMGLIAIQAIVNNEKQTIRLVGNRSQNSGVVRELTLKMGLMLL